MAGPLLRVVLWAFLLCSGAVFAQEKDQSLADIRQDLGVLYIEIQKLKRELSTAIRASLSPAKTLPFK